MLLITGTQRTGTSLLSKFLKNLGYDMGTDFWHNDINGGLESPDICLYYRERLQDPTFPFSDFPKVVGKGNIPPLSTINYDVQKFSYLLMDPEFVDIWVKERGDKNDKLIILMREAEHICKSKSSTEVRKNRFSTDSKRITLSPEKLKQNYYDSILKLLDANIDFRLLKFPNFLTDYDLLYDTLHNFGGLNIKYNPEKWNSLVDLSKITIK